MKRYIKLVVHYGDTCWSDCILDGKKQCPKFKKYCSGGVLKEIKNPTPEQIKKAVRVEL